MTGSLNIKLGSSGGGGSTAWGAITGTLSNQTDLVAALALKADLSNPDFVGRINILGDGITSGLLHIYDADSSHSVRFITSSSLAANYTITIPAETGTLALCGANTFTALQQFTGTTHAGLRLNNLTTAERDAIASPQAGMCIWNTTAARLQLHNGSAWTAGMVRLDGDTMTGALTIGVGTNSPTPAAGLTLSNSTAATVGVQSASPEYLLSGRGWKTAATAGSQTVSWGQSVLPVQGTTSPSAIWRLQGYVNGSAVANPQLQAQTNGPLIITGASGNPDVLLLRQPDGYMGSAANFTLGGSGQITMAGTLQVYPSITGVRVIENANSSNFLSLIASPTLQSISSSSNVVTFSNGTNAQTVRINGTYTDASNYVRLAFNTTSTTLGIVCETAGTGADDIDLSLTPAGTGNVRFGTHSAVGAETVTGFITIKDSGGTSRKLAVIS